MTSTTTTTATATTGGTATTTAGTTTATTDVTALQDLYNALSTDIALQKTFHSQYYGYVSYLTFGIYPHIIKIPPFRKLCSRVPIIFC
jgi:hypothetical protein